MSKDKKKMKAGFVQVIVRMLFELPNRKKGKGIRSRVFSIQDVVNLFPEFQEENNEE